MRFVREWILECCVSGCRKQAKVVTSRLALIVEYVLALQLKQVNLSVFDVFVSLHGLVGFCETCRSLCRLSAERPKLF